MNNFLNSLLCGFRKAHSTQYALFRLLQAWQKELDQCGFAGTVLMDLSKAYDCLPHDLLIAKLEAYGLDTTSLSLIKNYLANRKQRTKVGSSYSDWFEFLRGIPQGSILLFIIHYCSIYLLMTYFLKYKNRTFVTLQMIIRCIFVAMTYKLLLKT